MSLYQRNLCVLYTVLQTSDAKMSLSVLWLVMAYFVRIMSVSQLKSQFI